MSETQALLADIERFSAEHKIAVTTFGERAVGNSKLVPRLKAGGSVTLKTVAMIRAFIARHSEGAAA